MVEFTLQHGYGYPIMPWVPFTYDCRVANSSLLAGTGSIDERPSERKCASRGLTAFPNSSARIGDCINFCATSCTNNLRFRQFGHILPELPYHVAQCIH